MRIAVLTEIPAPYRIPLFNALAALGGVGLEVIYLSERDPVRPYPIYANEFRFDWSVLPGRETSVRGRWTIVSVRTSRTLRRARPDVVVVGGWNQPAFWVALAWARRRGIPVVCWVESTARDARARSRVAQAAKRIFIRRCAGFLVPGLASAEYLEAIDVDGRPVAVAPNAVDHEIFGARVAALREHRDALRAELGISGLVVFYAGRLDPDKDVGSLISAMDSVDAELVIAGDGSDGAALRGRAGERTRFLGRLERDELVPWYAAADLFVLPARSDQWGMVLNEAVTAGLPVVSTEAPGAAWDLVDDTVNGFRVPTGDVEALAA
ncbi:MAG TPA: glycosyltransferase, partial [Gaiellaceae bacterium]